jgi:hypothetical protein
MIKHDVDKFFHGFIPVWALALFSIAIIFVFIFIAGLICYFVGCGRSRQNLLNNIQSSIVEQPLLIENNQLQTKELSQKSEDLLF